MKKIFTLVMLSILTVMTAQAAVETVLWEGDLWISWEGGNTDDAHKQVSISDVANFADDQVMYVYLAKDTDADHLAWGDYHTYRLDGDWDTPLIENGVNDDYVKVKFTVTSAIKTSLGAKTFNIHGHGIRVLRVTKEVADCPNDIKSAPDAVITDWSHGNYMFNLDANSISTGVTLYMLVTTGEGSSIRYSDNNQDWATNTDVTSTLDGNGIVTVALSNDFVSQVLTGTYHEIAFWGNNYTINAIATSKDALLQLKYGLLVNMDANGYATFCSNWKLDIAALPAGVEAYTATLTGKTLSFTKKDDEAVDAGTGLMLKGAAWNPYKIPVTTGTSSAVAGNALSANLTDQTLQSDGSTYIFVMAKANSAGSLTFKKLPDSPTAIPANKAYVQVAAFAFSNSAPELNISFGETTGIESIDHSPLTIDHSVYNLAGQRVAQPTKGLYIVNGKKVVIR